MTLQAAPRVPRIFISYSRADTRFARALDEHLAGLKTAHSAVVFFDQRWIRAGTEWMRELHGGMEDSDVFVFLLSRSFIASKFCVHTEAKRALERRRAGAPHLRILYVLLSDCDYEDLRPDPHGPRLGDLQGAGPFRAADGRLVPLRTATDQDRHWKRLIDEIKSHYGIGTETSTAPAAPATHAPAGQRRAQLPAVAGAASVSEATETTDPDWEFIAARCDRDSVLHALDDMARDRGGVIVLHGPTPQVPSNALIDRFGRDLTEELKLSSEVINLQRLAEPGDAEQFVRSVCVNANMLGTTGKSPTREGLWTWLRQRGRELLVVAHYLQADALDEQALARQFRLAREAQLALHHDEIPVIIVLVLRRHRPEAAPPIWSRLKALVGAAPRNEPVALAFAATFGPEQADGPYRCVRLGDLEEEHLRKWRDLPDVRQAIALRIEQVDQAIETISQRGPKTLASLDQHLRQIFKPVATGRRTQTP